MRVLLINKYHYPKGGAERAYFDTAHILAEKGHEVIFFATTHPNNLATPWAKYFPPGVDYHDPGHSLFAKMRIAGNILWNRKAAENLEKLIIDAQPEVAHLHNIYHQLSPSILFILKKHGIPIAMTLHDYKLVSPNYNLFVRGQTWEQTSGLRCLIDACVKDSFVKSAVCVAELWLHTLLGSYRKIDRFIAPSDFLISQMKKLGFSQSIEKVPQPLVPFPEAPIGKRGEHLLFFGRLSSEKGAHFLLETFRHLPEEKVIFVGSGPEEAYLKQKIAEWQMTNVQFVGFQFGQALTDYITNAKAVIIPSLWPENMPYTVLEALAAGKIVIASSLGGIPERIKDGENGFLFEAGNAEDFVAAVQRLNGAAQEDLNRMEKAAFESIEDLQPKNYGATLEKIYQELLSAKK